MNADIVLFGQGLEDGSYFSLCQLDAPRLQLFLYGGAADFRGGLNDGENPVFLDGQGGVVQDRLAQQVGGELLQLQGGIIIDTGKILEQVLELSRVSGPGIRFQKGAQSGGKHVFALAGYAGKQAFLQKIHIGRRVLRPVFQGRDLQGGHTEGKEEFPVEGMGADLFIKISAGREDQAEVDWDLLGAAFGKDAVFLEDLQKILLHGRGHQLCALDKQRAVIGHGKNPVLQGGRAGVWVGGIIAGEGSDQVFGRNGSGREDEKRGGLAPGIVMDGAGQRFPLG